MVTAVIAPSRAPLTPSRPAIAPDGTRMRQPCFSARAAQPSSTPTSAPTERTIRCLLAGREHRGAELAERGLGGRLDDQVGPAAAPVERPHRTGGRGRR